MLHRPRAIIGREEPALTETETLERARHALEAHAWQQAYEAFLALDEQGLSSDDLERLAESAWWSAHPNESIEAVGRAFASFSAENRGRDAARIGLRLALEHADRQDSAVSNASRSPTRAASRPLPSAEKDANARPKASMLSLGCALHQADSAKRSRSSPLRPSSSRARNAS